jgi:hypothetical protein
MEQSSSREDNMSLGESGNALSVMVLEDLSYNSPPVVPILSQFNPPPSLILPFHIYQGLSSDLFPTGFPINIVYTFFVIGLDLFTFTNAGQVISTYQPRLQKF